MKKIFWNYSAAISVIGLMSIIFSYGCSPAHYRNSADGEVYKIIDHKSEFVPDMPADFTIEDATQYEEICVPEVMELADAITIAVDNSRRYQSRKEALYTQALSLTLDRHQFDVIPFGAASGDIFRDTFGETSISGSLTQGLSKMLATGADLSLAITTSAFRYISTGDASRTARTAISASVFQPLLQGAGRDVVLENLTQAERDMIYEIRDFIRYRRSFSVDVAKNYYQLLQRADEVQNASRNFENLQFLRARAESMSQAGRLAPFQVDQALQRELQARDNWIRNIERYEAAVDNFKLQLGIPVDIQFRPDPDELLSLRDLGVEEYPMPVTETIKIALNRRLDLKTVKERVEDAIRKITVAENNLKPRLDLILDFAADTPGNKPLKFSDMDTSYGLGLDFTFPYDKKAERNSYRRSLISFQASEREFFETIDEVKLEVREAYRSIIQTAQSYEIQEMSLRLAERRVESTRLLHQAGRAITRDVLEAEQDLLNAQNTVTQALINHLFARLDLLIAMESLRIDERGLWGELSEQVKMDDEECLNNVIQVPAFN